MSMYNQDTEVLFPSRVIPSLAGLHGEGWRNLVERVRSEESLPAEQFAFVLLMARMCGCAACNADSFRAMRGCTQCARQVVRRNRGADRDLLEQYQQAQREVEAYLARNAEG